MQVRWTYKLHPNKQQQSLMQEWLVTLRKHRNRCLREREDGYNNNNLKKDSPIAYAYSAFCDSETKVEYGACCPLTCAVLKHGVVSDGLTKTTKKGGVKWGQASDIQSKWTTKLRKINKDFAKIDSDVLQRNLAKLDAAFVGFWKYGRGFPKYAKKSSFKSFEYKPNRCKFQINQIRGLKHRYSKIYLPAIGWMSYYDSRSVPENADIRTITVTQKAEGWYISVLLDIPVTLPQTKDLEDIQSIVGIDVGINKLVALSDGSFVENPRLATNKRLKRRLKLRQRKINRKEKGSSNRAKAGKKVAKLHKLLKDKRDAYQWKAAKKIVNTSEAIAHEDLNIQAMKKRCKPKKIKGRFMPNGQSAKRSLNRSISDASWGSLFQKIAWLALKVGKPVVKFNPKNTSRECSNCGHISKDNREGEKFICEECGYSDHADTQGARNGLKRVGLKFVSTRQKNLPADCGKVTLVRYDSAVKGERNQGKNPKSKTKKSEYVQLNLFEPGILEDIV